VEQSRASDTAVLSAIQRAAHQALDGSPTILADPVAVGLVPGSAEEDLRQSEVDYSQPLRKLTRSGLVLRSRFAEDQISVAAEERVPQYLILGVGFDTFAFRRHGGLERLSVFEVDHPATQQRKTELLERAGLNPAGRVTFCPVDFERVSLTDGLADSGFVPAAPALVTWLGVAMHLTGAAIEETCRFVLSLPSPSRLVFTFFQPPDSTEDPAVREQTESLVQLAAEHGEPMISLFTPAELDESLRGLGFSHVEHFTGAQAEARYRFRRIARRSRVPCRRRRSGRIP